MDRQSYKPTSVAHPGETVVDYLESYGWSQRDLSKRSGITPKTISEICNGKAGISTQTSIAFEKVFNRPAHFWINLQSNYDEHLVRLNEAKKSGEWFDWLKNFPLKEIKERGWLPKSSDDELTDFLIFFGVSSPQSWNTVWQSSNQAFRQTSKFKISEFAVSAWLRRLEILSDEFELKSFNDEELLNSIETLRRLTRDPLDSALEAAQSILSKSGIALIIEPSLPQTGISGCTYWIKPKKAILGLTLRTKWEDQIWFTLFHELGHILLHRKYFSCILDNAETEMARVDLDPNMQKFEEEADRFAADTLIPPHYLSKFISFNMFDNDAIHDFAEAIGISPGIVVGRLQRESILQPWQGNALKQKAQFEYQTDKE